MSIATLENEIVTRAKTITGNMKLSRKGLMEWRNAELKCSEGEIQVYIPELALWCCFIEPKKK